MAIYKLKQHNNCSILTENKIDWIDELECANLNDSENSELKHLLYEYRDIFDSKLSIPGGASGVSHVIETGEN